MQFNADAKWGSLAYYNVAWDARTRAAMHRTQPGLWRMCAYASSPSPLPLRFRQNFTTKWYEKKNSTSRLASAVFVVRQWQAYMCTANAQLRIMLATAHDALFHIFADINFALPRAHRFLYAFCWTAEVKSNLFGGGKRRTGQERMRNKRPGQ